MKILLLVQRETGPYGVAWVEDAVDEFSLEETNGQTPDSWRAKVDADPSNFRELWLDVPKLDLSSLWDVPEVAATVSDAS